MRIIPRYSLEPHNVPKSGFGAKLNAVVNVLSVTGWLARLTVHDRPKYGWSSEDNDEESELLSIPGGWPSTKILCPSTLGDPAVEGVLADLDSEEDEGDEEDFVSIVSDSEPDSPLVSTVEEPNRSFDIQLSDLEHTSFQGITVQSNDAELVDVQIAAEEDGDVLEIGYAIFSEWKPTMFDGTLQESISEQHAEPDSFAEEEENPLDIYNHVSPWNEAGITTGVEHIEGTQDDPTVFIETSDRLIPAVDASTNVSIEGTTYNIESSTVHFIYGSHLSGHGTSQVLDACIEALLRSFNAEYDMVLNSPRGPCTPYTRIEVINEIVDWCNSNEKTLFWLSGMAGTGKTTVLYSICKLLENAQLLGASFFCSRLLPDCRDIKLILSTIAVQLARRYLPYAKSLASVLKEDPDILRRELGVQLRKLIIDPWNAKKAELPGHTIVVLDALDECEEDSATFLQMLFDNVSDLPFKILVASRPEFTIRNVIRSKGSAILSSLTLHGIEDNVVRRDIIKFLESELSHCATPEIINFIADLAGSLFIYAATLARLFTSANVNILARLRILDQITPSRDKSKMMTPLDQLYRGVMAYILSDALLETERQGLMDIIHTVICAREPLTRLVLAELCAIEVDEVNRRLESLHSVIFVPQDHNRPITALHASFPDFMMDNSRSREFGASSLDTHLQLTRQCLAILDSKLRPNLCLVEGRPSNNSINPHVISASITPGLQYAATYISDHWSLCDHQSSLSSIRHFLTIHIFGWFECLSLLGRLAISVGSLDRILDLLSEEHDLASLAYDFLRFIQQCYDVIEFSAMETYASALIWIPTDATLRKYYSPSYKQSPRVLCGLPVNWSGPERVLDLSSDSGAITSIAISEDGNRIASGTDNGVLHVWDLRNQIGEYILRGNNGLIVNSVALFRNGDRVVSGTNDHLIRVWDTLNHDMVLKLDTRSTVVAVAISPNEQWIASGHSNYTIRIWDATSGNLIRSLVGHTSPVQSISFMPQSTYLVSAALSDDIARVWNVMTGETEALLCGRVVRATGGIRSVACAPCGDKIITGSTDKTARLWDTSGQELQVLRGHSNGVNDVAFLPDSKRIITGSADGTLRVWDIATGRTTHTFRHAGEIDAIAVFPNGLRVASTSEGRNSINIWSIRGRTLVDRLEGRRGINESPLNTKTRSVAFSQNGRRALLLPSLRLLNTTNLDEIALLRPSQSTDYFRGAVSASGRKVAAASGRTVDVWEMTDDDGLEGRRFTLQKHAKNVLALIFSHDECLLVSASGTTARLWDATTGDILQVLNHPLSLYDSVHHIAFSRDDSQMISMTYHAAYVWHTRSGRQLHKFRTDAASIGFTPKDRFVVALSNATETTAVSILNTQTFKSQYTFEGYHHWTMLEDGSSYAFHHDGWIYRFEGFNNPPRRLLWVPASYRPYLPTSRISDPDRIHVNGSIFTMTSQGVQACLPRQDGLITLLIPPG